MLSAAEKVSQLRSRIAQTLNVHTGKELLRSSGWVGAKSYASPRHGRLTISPARTSLASLIRDAVRLSAALLDSLFEQPRTRIWT